MIKNLQDFILLTGEALVVDFHNGNFVIENKNFVEGKQTQYKLQGIGISLELAAENFIDCWKTSKRERKLTEDDLDKLKWYSSH